MSIRWTREAMDELAALPKFDAARILDEVELHLSKDPGRSSRRRKRIQGLIPPWTGHVPFWQLRVDPYRIFYDVLDGDVIVRAIRLKPYGKTTKEIL